MKVVNNNNEIIKPTLYARSTELYHEGDRGLFNSSGWEISGVVQSIRMFDDDIFISSDGYHVYEVYNYKKLKWIGIERTEEEQEIYDKEQDKKRQLKLKFK